MTTSKLFVAAVITPLAVATFNVGAASAHSTSRPHHQPPEGVHTPDKPRPGALARTQTPNKPKCYTKRVRMTVHDGIKSILRTRYVTRKVCK